VAYEFLGEDCWTGVARRELGNSTNPSRGGSMTGPAFEEHTHDPMVHTHEHWHVTHHWSETAGTFEHLASKHSHEHDHADLTHSHVPHANFDNEHSGEAHIHDHDEPVHHDQRG
jgi:hypothetical protein